MALTRLFLLVAIVFLIVPVASEPDTAVAAPPDIGLADLPDPYPWPPRIFKDDPVPLEFAVDLDRLAPLGSKPGNGAPWFAAFSKNIGERVSEFEAAQTAALEWQHYGNVRKVLPPDHPLLLEAEAWIDHATWSFYPEVYSWQGGATPIPNLLLALQLGRSWVARGQTTEDPDLALADFRRTIRLGRLLLQDDVIFVQNLIGVALVRFGAEGFFSHARAHGDGATAAYAALVLQDCTALRLELTRRFQGISVLSDFVARIEEGDGKTRTELRLPEARFDDLLRTSVADPCTAIRIESVIPLWITSEMGTTAQREKAKATLTKLESDPDEIVSAAAVLILKRPFDPDDLEAHWVQ